MPYSTAIETGIFPNGCPLNSPFEIQFRYYGFPAEKSLHNDVDDPVFRFNYESGPGPMTLGFFEMYNSIPISPGSDFFDTSTLEERFCGGRAYTGTYGDPYPYAVKGISPATAGTVVIKIIPGFFGSGGVTWNESNVSRFTINVGPSYAQPPVTYIESVESSSPDGIVYEGGPLVIKANCRTLSNANNTAFAVLAGEKIITSWDSQRETCSVLVPFTHTYIDGISSERFSIDLDYIARDAPFAGRFGVINGLIKDHREWCHPKAILAINNFNVGDNTSSNISVFIFTRNGSDPFFN